MNVGTNPEGYTRPRRGCRYQRDILDRYQRRARQEWTGTYIHVGSWSFVYSAVAKANTQADAGAYVEAQCSEDSFEESRIVGAGRIPPGVCDCAGSKASAEADARPEQCRR